MDFYHRGNAFYVDEEYEAAAENYSLAEESLPTFAPIFSSRAATNLKLKKYNYALQDCNTALRLSPDLQIAHHRKGLVCFELEEFETAKKSFEAALQLLNKTKDNSLLKRWIRKCDIEITELDGPPTTKNIPQTKQTENSQIPTPTPTPDASIVPKGSSEPDNIKPKTNSSVVPFNPIKYQYYQSGDCLNISILVKGISEEEVSIVIESDHLKVVCKGEVVIDKQLHALINLEKSKYEIRKSKIDIVLWKCEQSLWPSIEGDGLAKPKSIKQPIPSEGEVPEENKRPKPYASHKDWDAVGNEIQKELDAEKPEGEEALQKLFKDIYSKADSATQRAMNKSFQTSGGTVLSTNWGEVSQKNYEEERQAPKGVEWKNWEGKKLKQVEDK